MSECRRRKKNVTVLTKIRNSPLNLEYLCLAQEIRFVVGIVGIHHYLPYFLRVVIVQHLLHYSMFDGNCGNSCRNVVCGRRLWTLWCSELLWLQTRIEEKLMNQFWTIAVNFDFGSFDLFLCQHRIHWYFYFIFEWYI